MSNKLNNKTTVNKVKPIQTQIVDAEEYALSEMLQWIFRSRIRKGEQINIYVPSLRMRELLENWLEEITPNIFSNLLTNNQKRV